MSDKKITVYCPTLNRPELLGRMIACFNQQTHHDRELVILDDGNQYETGQVGDRWELVTVPRRFRSLAEKNNAAIALASFDSQLIAKWDDDEIYMPWALEASVEALSRGEICQPKLAIDFYKGRWVQIETFNRSNPNRFCYHSCFSFRRSFYEKIRGYAPGQFAGDDQELDARRVQMGIESVDIDPKYQPFMWYNRPLPGRISERGGSQQAYIDTGNNVPYVGKIPKWTGEKVWEKPVPTEVIQRWW